MNALFPKHSEVEALLYVQETQLDKFHQELAVNKVSENMAHTGQKEKSYRGNYSGNRVRGHKFSRGRGRCRITSNS